MDGDVHAGCGAGPPPGDPVPVQIPPDGLLVPRMLLEARQRERAMSGARKCSENGLDLIEHEEGFVDHVYLDQVGRRTAGIGHLCRWDERFANGITHQAARLLLRVDVATAERAVNACVQATLTQGQFDALVSLAFNIGGVRLARSKLVGKLNAGDIGVYNGGDPHKLTSYTGALREWAEFRMGEVDKKAVVLDVLVKRRAREIAKFIAATPDDGPVAA